MTTFWTENSILTNQNETTPPGEIFDEFCQAIGYYYQQKGYKYTRSRPKVKIESRDLFVEINFWSSRSNMAGSSVGLEILPYVGSKKLKKWIKTNKTGRNEYIYGPTKYDFRFQNIYGATVDFFLDLILKIDKYIAEQLDIADNKKFIDKLLTENSNEIITDNFACYLAMNNDLRLQEFIESHPDGVSSELVAKLKELTQEDRESANRET
ncbi:hypothetical protein [Niastella sp. OAS944]|uniref:hypothetical protein n=1 Tax=Niastella sp. OAS944 TaxID=2664089 RepID=UPI00348CE58E|nr:hypothetical protein [Chitinophagaceae bacterium OAS944]